MLTGLHLSEAHPENGMTLSDMQACERAAERLGEVIIFRSTGPWAKRWLREGFPSKNFHVKGKSSNWGPQAGLVPYDGVYSKVGADPEKALKGTRANQKGLDESQFAVKSILSLTAEQIEVQCTERAEGRLAVNERMMLPNGNIVLMALRHGDGRPFSFIAKKITGDRYDIYVYSDKSVFGANPVRIAAFDSQGSRAEPLYVMGSAEVGANGMPMTGDYDLLAVCPPMRDRFGQVGFDKFSSTIFAKDDIHLRGPSGQQTLSRGLRYAHGVGLDNVLDGRLHTASDQRAAHAAYNKKANLPYVEHQDLGNVTPRILRCINMLNAEMGATGGAGWTRRVHHNAESHRFADFGALTRTEMLNQEGFPFTAFLPRKLATAGAVTARYTSVCTLENMPEFEGFCSDLDRMEYWVPTNFTWGMRNKVADKIQMFNAMGGPMKRRLP